jgi:hypothetical protein
MGDIEIFRCKIYGMEFTLILINLSNYMTGI